MEQAEADAGIGCGTRAGSWWGKARHCNVVCCVVWLFDAGKLSSAGGGPGSPRCLIVNGIDSREVAIVDRQLQEMGFGRVPLLRAAPAMVNVLLGEVVTKAADEGRKERARNLYVQALGVEEVGSGLDWIGLDSESVRICLDSFAGFTIDFLSFPASFLAQRVARTPS